MRNFAPHAGVCSRDRSANLRHDRGMKTPANDNGDFDPYNAPQPRRAPMADEIKTARVLRDLRAAALDQRQFWPKPPNGKNNR